MNFPLLAKGRIAREGKTVLCLLLQNSLSFFHSASLSSVAETLNVVAQLVGARSNHLLLVVDRTLDAV